MIGVMKKVYMLFAPLLFAACTTPSGFELPNIISDGMVIQQNSNITFWGKAFPGTRITMHTDWDMAVSTTAKTDSTWELQFATKTSDTLSHQLKFELSDTIVTLDNVLIGEVWLASGQSNMEMPMEGWGNDSVANAKELIKNSKDKLLRYFNVERRFQFKEEGDIRGRWQEANENTTAKMSATAYLYAKTLRDSLNVPIGIINASWGGTPIESWIDSSTLIKDEDFTEDVKNFKVVAEEMKLYKEWLKMLPKVNVEIKHDDQKDPLEIINIDDEFAILSTGDYETWDTIQLPVYWETLPMFGEFDGVVWFAKQVQIPPSWIGQKLQLNLGPIDDRDVTFVNGMCVGRHDVDGVFTAFRSYEIPPQYVKKTSIKIVVRVTDTKGYGGFSAYKHEMTISNQRGDIIPISGKWNYRVSAELVDGNLYLFNTRNNQFALRPRPSKTLNQMSPTAIYNGMIEPLKKVSLAGVIWYQGETNVDKENHLQYERLLKNFFDCWRKTFNNANLPIYVVQIAPWEYTGCDKIEAGLIRAAQHKATSQTRNTYLIPTLDLGSELTIHPSNKTAVAERLANTALCKQYGYNDNIPLYPTIRKVSIVGPLIVITYDNAKMLMNNAELPNLFEIANESMEFIPANVIVRDNEVSLFSHLISDPVVFRYAIKNCVTPTLFNEYGLPAATVEERGN